tara:strand:- start:178 stop:381 length:204 start_codon:yes stop_codon:yes gene_type:complete
MADTPSWFTVIKNKQSKLPKEITAGAQTGKPLKDWKYKKIPKKKKSKEEETQPKSTDRKPQTKLDLN